MPVDLIFILLWFIHPVSVTVSLILKYGKTIPVLNKNNSKYLGNWERVQRYGLIACAVTILYIAVILFLGWTFRWYIGLLVIQSLLFLIMDRYFIAVNYNKKYWQEKPLKIRRKIKIIKVFSNLYLLLRIPYILLFLFWFIIYPPSLFIAGSNTIDLTVYGIYVSLINKTKIVERHTPFGTDIHFGHRRYSSFSSKKYFDGKVVVWWNTDHCDNIYLFTTHLGIFMKYVTPPSLFFSCRIDPSEYEYDKDNNVLYIDDPVIGENRSTIKYIDNKFYLEYYRFYNVDISNEDSGLTAPVIVEL
ncbi:MAG TPA: hypothetical protein VKY82_10190 [Flavobacterium sp.]|nr:hypothetical protein [Flavobacterium sp.]